ncbi:MAG: hypothetical protein ACM34K_09620 [Bacillota bacterium]
MLKKVLVIFFSLLLLHRTAFPGTPRPYKTVSKAVVNGYLQTITTYYTPVVKYKKVATLKNVFKNGVLLRQDVVYETRPVVTWKKRSQYDYSPLIK